MNESIIKFQPNIHKKLWGQESWEVSVHKEGPSVIANGPHSGVKLSDVINDMHLLVKVIESNTRLSVQVHPNERTCKLTGGEPKTEMWCMLEDGVIYAGLKEGVTPSDIEAAVKSGKFEELLVRHEAKAGDVFFIPGGLVHAIGENAKIYEVQQSSDTTFRLYDWNRVDASGKPRQLHIEESLKAIDYNLPPPKPVKELACEFFKFRQTRICNGSHTCCKDKTQIFYIARGEVNAGNEILKEGTSFIVRPGEEITLSANDATLFITEEPDNAIPAERLADYIISIPDFPKPGILFRDITGLLDSEKAFRNTIQYLARELEGVIFDAIAAPESRGFIFGAALAYSLHKPFIPIRKPGKLPRETVSEDYELEYGINTLQVHKASVKRGAKIVLVDDLLATGGTATAAIRLLEQLGATVPEVLFPVELMGFDARNTALRGRRVYSLIQFPGK